MKNNFDRVLVTAGNSTVIGAFLFSIGYWYPSKLEGVDLMCAVGGIFFAFGVGIVLGAVSMRES